MVITTKYLFCISEPEEDMRLICGAPYKLGEKKCWRCGALLPLKEKTYEEVFSPLR